jgi:hypothetical protein
MREDEILRAAQGAAIQQAGVQATRVHAALAILQSLIHLSGPSLDGDPVIAGGSMSACIEQSVVAADALLRRLGLTR